MINHCHWVITTTVYTTEKISMTWTEVEQLKPSASVHAVQVKSMLILASSCLDGLHNFMTWSACHVIATGTGSISSKRSQLKLQHYQVHWVAVRLLAVELDIEKLGYDYEREMHGPLLHSFQTRFPIMDDLTPTGQDSSHSKLGCGMFTYDKGKYFSSSNCMINY